MKNKEALFVAKLKAHEPQALAQFVQTYTPILYRYASWFMANKKEVEDLVQETLMAALDGMDRFKEKSGLKTWLIQIFHHKAYKLFAHQRKEPSFDANALETTQHFDAKGMWKEGVPEWKTNPENFVLEKEMHEIMRKAIDELPSPYREIIVLRDIEGLSSEEVCNVFGISETNMRVILHRARLRLKAKVDNFMNRD